MPYFLRGNHAFERSQEKKLQQKVLCGNKEKIADKKKTDYQDNL